MTYTGMQKDDSLIGASCPTAKSCFAVGVSVLHSTARTLVEYWNGHGGWSIMHSPDPSNPSLRGISCPSTTHCVAVGSAWGLRNTSHGQRAFAEQYG